MPAYDPATSGPAMSFRLDYYGEPDRGAVPAWANEMAEMSWRPWLTFDGLAAAETARTPALFVHGDDCMLPDNVSARSPPPWARRRSGWPATQIDFYDQPAQVDAAVAAADAHFRAAGAR